LHPKLPSRDKLLTELHAALQEIDPRRPLDSIEIVTIRAYMTRWGLEHPQGMPFPSTIEGWVEWAVRFSIIS
jgi:hypothetical protein